MKSFKAFFAFIFLILSLSIQNIITADYKPQNDKQNLEDFLNTHMSKDFYKFFIEDWKSADDFEKDNLITELFNKIENLSLNQSELESFVKKFKSFMVQQIPNFNHPLDMLNNTLIKLDNLQGKKSKREIVQLKSKKEREKDIEDKIRSYINPDLS